MIFPRNTNHSRTELSALFFFSLKLHTNNERKKAKVNVSDLGGPLEVVEIERRKDTLRDCSPHCSDIPREEMNYNRCFSLVSLVNL